MLFSELAGKVIIDLEDGEVLGNVGDVDLLVNEVTGDIEALLLPAARSLRRYGDGDGVVKIAWADVKKIGPEIIFVRMDRPGAPLW